MTTHQGAHSRFDPALRDDMSRSAGVRQRGILSAALIVTAIVVALAILGYGAIHYHQLYGTDMAAGPNDVPDPNTNTNPNKTTGTAEETNTETNTDPGHMGSPPNMEKPTPPANTAR